MQIATFGSWIEGRPDSPWVSRGGRQQFEDACRAIGKAIANLGHTVVVGSSNPRTADRLIVDGVLASEQVSEQRVPNIRVIRPYDETVDYAKLSDDHPHSFRFSDRIGLKAAGVKVLAVKDADAVLTIGGGEGTYMAGLAAILADKPLIPIASFGGASRYLIEAARQLKGITNLDDLNHPWGAGLLESGVIARLRRPLRILLVHGRSNDWQDLKNWLVTKMAVDVRVMKEEFGDGKTLPEKFEQLARGADGAIALATPDDIGGLAGESAGTPAFRARENVWIEYGWFWGRLGRKRVMLLHKGQVLVPSDLNGLEYYSYVRDPLDESERIRTFLERLRSRADENNIGEAQSR